MNFYMEKSAKMIDKERNSAAQHENHDRNEHEYFARMIFCAKYEKKRNLTYFTIKNTSN